MEKLTTWSIIVVLTVGFTLLFCRFMGPSRAALAAAFLATALFEAEAAIELGYFDAFWPISSFVSLIVGIPIALFVAYFRRALIARKSAKD